MNIENMTDEQISVRLNDFKRELQRNGEDINTKQFVKGIRNGKYDYQAWIDARKSGAEEMREHAKNIVISKTPDIPIIKCPTCQSTKVHKIGTLNRMVSTGLFGLASSKIGKSFKCNGCGYTW